MIVLIRPWPNILLLQGKYVLTEMKKLTVSNNPTWSMEEKHLDLARREREIETEFHWAKSSWTV